MTDTQRLDFIQLILSTGISVGLKPNGTALIGSVYVEGAENLRDLIDKIKRINDEEEQLPDDKSKNPE